jgi:hypothetical protein
MATVTSRHRSRRVVRRRAQAALDRSYDAVLAELPVEVRPLVRAYANNLRQGMEIRSALSAI